MWPQKHFVWGVPPRILWTYDLRGMVWDEFTLEPVEVWSQVKGLGEGSPWSLWKCDIRSKAWEGGHPGDCGRVTLGAGFRERAHSGDYWNMTPGARFGDTGHPAKCGHVIPGAGPERGHHPGDCGYVTLCTGTGCGSCGRRWICEASSSSWRHECVTPCTVSGRGSPWRPWTCNHRYRVWERFSLGSVDLCPQV